MSRTTFYAAALASALLTACGPVNQGIAPASRGLEPVNQPVVSRTDYVLDLAGGYDGLAEGEVQRLDGWFRSLEIGYGDTLYVEDATPGSARRAAIEEVAGNYGLGVRPGVPATAGRVPEGYARVILSRTEAYVPGCPIWERESDLDLTNAQGSNYGCATNSNLAAMIADPEDLVRGREAGALSDTRAVTKAVRSFREQQPTGQGGLKSESASGGSSN